MNGDYGRFRRKPRRIEAAAGFFKIHLAGKHLRNGTGINIMIVHIAQRRFNVGITEDVAVVDENQPVSVRKGRFQRMFDDDDGMAVGYIQIVNQFIELVGTFRVQGRRRFIKDQDVGISRQDVGNDQTLTLAAGQLGQGPLAIRQHVDFFPVLP